MWPPWLTDARCLRILVVGLAGTCLPGPLAVIAAVVIVGDVVYGYTTRAAR